MTEKEIEMLFEQHEEVCEAELEALRDRVKNGEDKEKVISEINEKCGNNAVAEYIIKRMNHELKPFEETAFLREMEDEDFEKNISYVFENTVFRSEIKETINEYLGMEENMVERIIKLANTVLHYYAVRRYTQNSFCIELSGIFNFKKSCIDFLWRFCEDNEDKMTTVITTRCYSMLLRTEKSINEMYNIFSTMLDEDNDE